MTVRSLLASSQLLYLVQKVKLEGAEGLMMNWRRSVLFLRIFSAHLNKGKNYGTRINKNLNAMYVLADNCFVPILS